MLIETPTIQQCPPEKVKEGYWIVFQTEGAFQVLRKEEFIEFLKDKPNDVFYYINCASFMRVSIKPDEPCWDELKTIAKDYLIRVFPIGKPKWEDWTGSSKDETQFDAIQIWKK